MKQENKHKIKRYINTGDKTIALSANLPFHVELSKNTQIWLIISNLKNKIK